MIKKYETKINLPAATQLESPATELSENPDLQAHVGTDSLLFPWHFKQEVAESEHEAHCLAQA